MSGDSQWGAEEEGGSNRQHKKMAGGGRQRALHGETHLFKENCAAANTKWYMQNVYVNTTEACVASSFALEHTHISTDTGGE